MKRLFGHFWFLSILTTFVYSQDSQNKSLTWKPYLAPKMTVRKENILSASGIRSFGELPPARFLTVDPLADDFPDWTPYHYVHNNPTNMVDPDGRFAIIDDFIIGFATGMFKGEGFSGAWDRGLTSADNSVQLWSSFGRGSVGQVVSKFTWELPQQLAGVVGGHVNNAIDNVQSVSHYEGATLLETRAENWGGYTIGSIVTADKNTAASPTDDIFKHEFGHYLQSQKLGPLYLPVIGIPSLGSAAFNPAKHSQFYTERWADQNSNSYFQNKINPRKK